MAAAIKSQLGTFNQTETTALRDNSRRLPHTISSLLPPGPKYEPTHKRLIPQSGLAYTHTYTRTHTLLVHPTPLPINGLSGSDQSSIFISPSSLVSPHPHPHIIMSSQAYVFPTGSGATGFFPNGPTAPHAFASMHTSPRDQHLMYASLGTPSFQGGKSSQVSAKSASKGSRSGKKQR
jgi:hypothetical protein